MRWRSHLHESRDSGMALTRTRTETTPVAVARARTRETAVLGPSRGAHTATRHWKGLPHWSLRRCCSKSSAGAQSTTDPARANARVRAAGRPRSPAAGRAQTASAQRNRPTARVRWASRATAPTHRRAKYMPIARVAAVCETTIARGQHSLGGGHSRHPRARILSPRLRRHCSAPRLRRADSSRPHW